MKSVVDRQGKIFQKIHLENSLNWDLLEINLNLKCQ
jgi:hypothetical protein